MKLCVALFAMVSLSLIGCAALQRPQLSDYAQYWVKPSTQVLPGVQVTFVGTSTLYLHDGETHILVDGFFSRPDNLWQLFFGKVSTNRQRVISSLDRLGIKKLDAIPVFHSHYDHAMDSAEIAQMTGATVLGSESTAWIARGAALPEAQIKVVEPRKSYRFGQFQLRFIPSKHVPLPGLIESTGMMGDIAFPLKQPASIFDYREGETYAIVIEHPLGTAMLHSGAFLPNELQGQKVDALFLCTPGLPKLSSTEQDQFYRELIAEPGVKRVIPVHWDDFSQSLDQPLVAMPRIAEDFDGAMAFLQRHPEMEINLLPAWQPMLLFPAQSP